MTQATPSSPGSIFPPGNSHDPAFGVPAGRRETSTSHPEQAFDEPALSPDVSRIFVLCSRLMMTAIPTRTVLGESACSLTLDTPKTG